MSPDPLVMALAQRRKEWHIARSVVAKALFVSYKTFWSWEQGLRQPPLDLVRRWAECLGLSLDLLDLMPAVDAVAVQRATVGELNPALLNQVERRLVIGMLNGKLAAGEIANRAGVDIRTVQRVQRATRKATEVAA